MRKETKVILGVGGIVAIGVAAKWAFDKASTAVEEAIDKAFGSHPDHVAYADARDEVAAAPKPAEPLYVPPQANLLEPETP